MAAAWGSDLLAWHSPARWPIRARVLLAAAHDDPYVPWEQATTLRDAMRESNPSAYVDTYQLPAGEACSFTPGSRRAL